MGGIIGLLFKVQILGGLMMLSTMYLTKSGEVSRLLLQTFLGVSFIGLVAEKVGVKVALDYFRKRQSSYLRKVLVVGTDSRAERYLCLLGHHPHWGAEVMGFLSANGRGSPQFCGKPVLGQPMDLSEVLRERVVDEVVAVSPRREGVDVEGLARVCAERGITFRILVEMPPAQVGRYNMEDLGRGLYLLSLETIPRSLSLYSSNACWTLWGQPWGLFSVAWPICGMGPRSAASPRGRSCFARRG